MHKEMKGSIPVRMREKPLTSHLNQLNNEKKTILFFIFRRGDEYDNR